MAIDLGLVPATPAPAFGGALTPGPASLDRHDDRVWKGRLAEKEPAACGPPHQVLASDFLICVVDLDPAALKALLPVGLEPGDVPTGIIGIYHAPQGFGGKPYSGCYISVAVKGRGIPDDVPTFMKLAGWYSGSAGRLMAETYDRRIADGEALQWKAGQDWTAIGGPIGCPAITLQMGQVAEEAPLSAGTHRLVGLDSEGELISYEISYSTRFFEAAPVRLEVDRTASAVLKQLGPIEPSFCYYSPSSILTFGAPKRLIETSSSEMLAILGQLGRAAVIVKRNGDVCFANGQALALLGDGVRFGRPLQVILGPKRRTLGALIERAYSGDPDLGPVIVYRLGDTTPLLVRAMRLGSASVGDGCILLLLGDPVERGTASKAGLLQLLGLSPAEAKLALLVGMGHPPKAAATLASITESTARSALKIVFHKLGICRQADLVQIVTRLDMM